jgi:sugar phosphate isomerase/epimerase
MENRINEKIVCAYLYSITKYGYPPPVDNYLKQIEEMAELGFHSIELEGIRESNLMEIFELKKDVKNKLNELNLKVPYFCVVLPGLSSIDDGKRNKQIELFEKGCEIAQTIGAKSVLDNGPLPPFTFDGDIPITRHYNSYSLANAYFPKNLNWKEYWDQLIITIRILCDISGKYGLTYNIHPAEGVLASTTDGFLYMHDQVKKDNLFFTFDTANQFAVHENLSLSLHRLKDHIEYIHVSDNSGSRIEHLEVGKGNINWEIFFETLDVIDYKGDFGLDIGGDESGVINLDRAYTNSAKFIQKKISAKI